MRLSVYTLTYLWSALAPLAFAFPHPLLHQNTPPLTKRNVDNLPSRNKTVTCPGPGHSYTQEQLKNTVQRGIQNTPTIEPQPGMFTFT